ncbi:protein TEX261 [Rhopalosiphum maidis]|uniref:protein TEX261 n=1 Tax=Rhopalosiphum maidis TaxID=43146 RepID=UPI000EFF0CCE|nr:protein TEX261 [Rhopalosiphum maidis]XP_026817738.1 protein TEX261 [Rhopalosiphum maidis]XP_028044432.1 protein TEX261 [Rhopalosiphum maidis]
MIFMILVIAIAAILQIALISVFIGAGVYYLAEFVEEHTALTKKVIKWTIHVVIICHIGLYLFDNIPLTLIALGLLSHIVYYCLLIDFPNFNLTSLSFILSIILLIGNHVLTFKFFRQRYTTLSEVFSYFTVCLWMVPFMFILSLSANDNTLPITNVDDNVVSHYFTNRKRNYKIKNLFTYLGDITGKNNHLK